MSSATASTARNLRPHRAYRSATAVGTRIEFSVINGLNVAAEMQHLPSLWHIRKSLS
jgi:hypothetical protein